MNSLLSSWAFKRFTEKQRVASYLNLWGCAGKDKHIYICIGLKKKKNQSKLVKQTIVYPLNHVLKPEKNQANNGRITALIAFESVNHMINIDIPLFYHINC